MIDYAEPKFICEDCGEVYDEYKRYCPACDGYSTREADLCKVKGCREYMVATDYCCAECKQDALRVLRDALALLDIQQIRYLDSVTEGVPLIEFWRSNDG